LKPRNRASGDVCEQSWVLIGQHRGRVWHAKKIARAIGAPASVDFDGPGVLAREEARGDVVGFLHTHPTFAARPSERDVKTMRAWVSAFGKPLICLIDGTDGLHGYRFDDDESGGIRLETVEVFARGVVIGVDADGG
jgi:proteasome lid subunit RPN8/RPN11